MIYLCISTERSMDSASVARMKSWSECSDADCARDAPRWRSATDARLFHTIHLKARASPPLLHLPHDPLSFISVCVCVRKNSARIWSDTLTQSLTRRTDARTLNQRWTRFIRGFNRIPSAFLRGVCSGCYARGHALISGLALDILMDVWHTDWWIWHYGSLSVGTYQSSHTHPCYLMRNRTGLDGDRVWTRSAGSPQAAARYKLAFITQNLCA